MLQQLELCSDRYASEAHLLYMHYLTSPEYVDLLFLYSVTVFLQKAFDFVPEFKSVEANELTVSCALTAVNKVASLKYKMTRLPRSTCSPKSLSNFMSRHPKGIS